MRSNATRLSRAYVLLTLPILVLSAGGCATPPSVAPLLRVTERALLDETARLEDDAQRDTIYTQQTLRTLEDAYNRDLDQAEALTPDWVRDATSVYVAARETIVIHQQALTRGRLDRADNLKAAAAATRQAIALIEQQDKLLGGSLDENLRRLITATDQAQQETSR